MKKNKWTFLVFVTLSGSLMAQDTLTLQLAIDQALRSNLQIEIARNDYEVSQLNNHAGNAGMLPNVALNAGDSPANSNIRQEFANGTTIEQSGVFSNAFNANVALSMNLYDGGRMFATREKLHELEALGETYLRASIQNVLSTVIRAYSNIITQEKYMIVLEQLSGVSDARYSLVRSRMEAGLANNTDLYLAQLDKDTRTQAIASQQANVRNAYTDLNVLLNFPVDTVYTIQQQMAIHTPLDRASLDALFRNNPEVQATEHLVEVAIQTEKETGALRYPRVGLTAAYGYTRSQSEAGFSLYNQSYGPSGSLTLSVPLFSGNVYSRSYKSAQVQTETARLQQQQSIASLSGSFEQAWQLYSTALQQVQADETSVRTAREYLDLMEQRYNLGQSTVIDFREAQRSFEETNFRLISNQYLLTIAETDLLRLTGQLVK